MSMNETKHDPDYLAGKLLIAMPTMSDPRFSKTVIYMCAHNAEGAMGLVINKQIDELTFPELLEQLEIDRGRAGDTVNILFGGPVEQARGFVLHSAEYNQEATMQVTDRVGLTATVDILRDIANGEGPKNRILALGYAGWGPGQLDSEILENGWLHVEADNDLLFGNDLDDKWEMAMQKIGIDPRMLSEDAGHA